MRDGTARARSIERESWMEEADKRFMSVQYIHLRSSISRVLRDNRCTDHRSFPSLGRVAARSTETVPEPRDKAILPKPEESLHSCRDA